MEKLDFNALSRRQFIRQAACAAVGTAGMTAAIRNLRIMNAAMAQSNVNDYKALVCIFLAGGNDSNNLIIPTIQSEWNNYATIRTPTLAIPLSGGAYNILPVTSLNPDGHTYGFHPSCPQLQQLFNAGKLAMLFNTGTLVVPLTKSQYNSKSYAKPPQLFSHADQVTQWQTSLPNQAPLTGWGGRVADLMAAVQPNAPVSLSITLAGANTFEVGNQVSEYSVSTSGAISLSGVATTRLTALTNILALPYPNLQTKAYADAGYHAVTTGTVLNNAISPTSSAGYWTVQFPGVVTQPTTGGTQINSNSSLGQQLRMIARLIQAGSRSVASGGFGMKRQIFFCSIGGYDLHTGQTNVPSGGSVVQGSHANLLAELSQSMYAFQSAMDQLGLGNNVTAFTSSDFGRTFPSNGLGSDHGWGSHHLIMGGAVHGQRTYGTFPALTVGGPDDTGTGRWLPTTATDQYFATLASWFGVDSGNLSTVFPNLGNFNNQNLGFV